MTNIEGFNLPAKCANCISLRNKIEEFRDISDLCANRALEVGMQAEALELDVGTSEASRKAAAARTEELLEVASPISDNLRIQTQEEMDVAEAFCDGTRDQESDELQCCNFVKSVVE